MNSNLTCPFCGSGDIKFEKNVQKDKLPLGQEFSYEKVIHECNQCGERGEFSDENDEVYLEAKEVAIKSSLESILTNFSEKGFSMVYIERALDLSHRTLSRWKSQGISASGLALMRMIHTFPWLLEVADKDYDRIYANKELVNQAMEVFSAFTNSQNIVTNFTVNSSQGNLKVSANFTKGTELQAIGSLSESNQQPEFFDNSQPMAIGV